MERPGRRRYRRRLVNGASLLLSAVAAIVGLALLAWILWTTFSRGLPHLSPALFTETTPAPGDTGGGLRNAFAGSALLCLTAIAIGAQWKVTTQVLFRAALPGVLTGVLLALARISGETAPLLFTAFGNPFWSLDMTGPVASVPVTMNAFANIADERLNGLAWAAAFCMTMFVLALGLIARSLLLRNRMSHD